MAEPCDHKHHETTVEIAALHDGREDDDGSATHTFVAEITLTCQDCGKPFGFKGLPVGVSLSRPTVGPDTREVRLPLFSPSELDLAGVLPGFTQERADIQVFVDALCASVWGNEQAHPVQLLARAFASVVAPGGGKERWAELIGDTERTLATVLTDLAIAEGWQP